MTYAQKRRLQTIEKRITKRLKLEKIAVFEIGKNLQLAKDILPRQDFYPWISLTWKGELRKSTAHRYLSIYNAFSRNWNKASEKLSLTVLYEVSKTNFPKELRKYIVKNPNLLAGCSISKLIRATKLYKDQKIDKDGFISYITTNLGDNNEIYQKLEARMNKLTIQLRSIQHISIPKNEQTAFLASMRLLRKELNLLPSKV
jgi:hypothetical protein